MFRLFGKFLKLFLPLDTYRALRTRFLNFREEHTFKILKNNIKRYYRLAIKYPRFYRKYSKEPIDENKVLFVEPSKLFSNNFELIYKQLHENYSYDIHIHLLRNFFVPADEYEERCIKLIKDIATAKYVFMDEGSNILGRVSFREGTIIAQVWHACGAFKKFGFSTADLMFGSTQKDMEHYPNYKYDSFVTVSSPEIKWAYAEAMGLPEGKVLPIGVSRTDVFYDNNFIKAARKKLEFFMPSSIGKKVILFAPTFRGRVVKATTATAFSIERFYESLSDDYVLIVKHHPYVKKPPVIQEKYRDFAVDFTNTMTIEELLCVADICISDYSSVIFEYSLFEKPMIFFDYDIDEYFDWRGFYYNYDELTPGPAFQTNREMIEYIKHIDEYFDKQQVIDFKNKFMSSCDGHSTARLMDRVFGEDLEKHKKELNPDTQISVQVFGGPEVESYKTWEDMETLSPENIRETIITEYPDINGKKILAYFGTERAKKYPATRPYMNWQDLFEDLDEQYIVLFTGVPKGYLPKKFQQKRFINIEKLLSEKELAVIADIIVTDCNYAAGVYGSQTKTTFIYLPDYKWYCADEEDYITTSKTLRNDGMFYEDEEELIAAVQDQKYQTLEDTSFIESYRKICTHFE